MNILKKIKSKLPIVIEKRDNHKYFILGNKKAYLETNCFNKSYSHDGNDAVLLTYYEENQNYKGFYIDLGALHPKHFSNTQLFYEKGWSGINIDATPGSMELFRKMRKRDINLEAGVSEKQDELIYYIFEESALNSFDLNLSEQRIRDGWVLKDKKKIKTFPINYLLDKYMPINTHHIDFIDIDIEGFELQILESLDFSKYAPDFFLIEDLYFAYNDIFECKNSPIFHFLNNKGYILIAKTKKSFIYQKGER